MKKKLLLLLSFSCLFIFGCEKVSVKNDSTLKDAYFTISKEIEQNDLITEDYLTLLLKGYTYEESDTIEDYIDNSDATVHLFKNGDEVLTIYNYNVQNKDHQDYVYVLENKFNSLMLTYSTLNSKDKLHTYVSTSDVDSYNNISLISDITETKLLNCYNQIVVDLLESKKLNINNITETIGIEPNIEDVENTTTGLKEKLYSFGNETEGISVYYSNNNEISRITYGLHEVLFLKDLILSKNNNDDDKKYPLTSVNMYVNSIEEQEKIESSISK